jgi:hypothetical protein
VSNALDSYEAEYIAKNSKIELHELAQALSHPLESDIFAGFSCSCTKTIQAAMGGTGWTIKPFWI